MRIAAIIEYDGSNFSGWQLQDNERTVQGVVENALASVADEPVRVTVAGRTDTGVHACAQVIHFDTQATRSDYSWVHGANSNLPSDVALRWAAEVPEEFNARYSASGREYRYIILNRQVRPTLLAKRVTHEYRLLDIASMQQAAGMLIGKHDFSAYRAIQCQAKNPVRELRRLEIKRNGEFVIVVVEANAFLHHMVRNIAGVLTTIGAGERSPGWAREVLESRDRRLGGMTSPADGLYFVAVTYPESFNIPMLSCPSALW
jgi:tRNA pseudouridine38-40 synthase